MTEAEAKHKWCPHMRLTVDAELEWRTNRGEQPKGEVGEGYVYFNCLGRDCMAWRWQTDGLVLTFDMTSPVFRRPPGSELHGYCGLAGKP